MEASTLSAFGVASRPWPSADTAMLHSRHAELVRFVTASMAQPSRRRLIAAIGSFGVYAIPLVGPHAVSFLGESLLQGFGSNRPLAWTVANLAVAVAVQVLAEYRTQHHLGSGRPDGQAHRDQRNNHAVHRQRSRRRVCAAHRHRCRRVPHLLTPLCKKPSRLLRRGPVRISRLTRHLSSVTSTRRPSGAVTRAAFFDRSV